MSIAILDSGFKNSCTVLYHKADAKTNNYERKSSHRNQWLYPNQILSSVYRTKEFIRGHLVFRCIYFKVSFNTWIEH